MLTDQDKKWIDENWDKKPIKDIVVKISGNKELDGRSDIGREIKQYISDKHGGAPKTTKFEKAAKIELTEEQKEAIRSSLAKGNKPLEITKILFGNFALGPLTKEFRAVYKFAGEVDPSLIKDEDAIAEEKYVIPNSLVNLVTRVNKAIPNPKNISEPLIDRNNITNDQNKKLTSLLRAMQAPRYSYEVNQYDKIIDRVIFESTFISYIFTKTDLSPEEIDQFVSLSSKIVETSILRRSVNKIETLITDELEDTHRLNQGLVDFLTSQREKLNQFEERQRKLYESLVVSRAKREDKFKDDNGSVIALIQAWKNQETREQMLQLAMKEKELEADEVEKISSLDRLLILVAGVSKNEAKE
jgi:hypothetical protein